MPTYHVEESIAIQADIQDVFDVVADYGSWASWSPWLCAEPDANVNISGPPGTAGSRYEWNGEIVGQGQIEHLRLSPSTLIEDELRIVKPFKSASKVCFRFDQSGDHTTVTWAMDGKLPWFLFWMTGSLKSMIGMDYERGLKMLKEWIETGAIASKTHIRGIESIDAIHVAGVRKQCEMDALNHTMEHAFSEANQELVQRGLSTEGEMISVYHHFDAKEKTFDFTAGYILPTQTDDPTLSTWSMEPGNALTVHHQGRYDHLGNAWGAAYQYARYKKLKISNHGTFEIYRNDPAHTPEVDLETEIYLPLK